MYNSKITPLQFCELNYWITVTFKYLIDYLIRNDLEIHETRNISERNRRFGASCAIIKVIKIKCGL